MANDHRNFTAFGGTPIERLIAERDSRSPIEDSMDLLRLLEYPQMLGKTYLDHAGTTPWAKSLINAYAASMTDTLYGNPHSEHKPSRDADARVETTRRKALEFFNADPDDFDLIFTPNATGAIKLVHDCFRDYSSDPDGRSWWYGYHKDSHTSVVGVREGTRNHRCYRSDREVDLWIEARGLGGAAAHEVGLFAYPGQSNMTGRRYPLDWPVRIRNRVKAEVYTLLDAAALASTAQIDLSDATRAPDLIAVSFYKIFGMPNLGALLVRKSSPVTEILKRRKFFGGGAVDMVIAVNDTWVDRKATLHSRLEDGTLPFTSIFALDIAIDIQKSSTAPPQ
ncbi:Molybdenum cofactor sulfurase [Pseudocercospora fuligena]|uniref:Molybdenum cofactor sulfurase n=1 Tax=Pseudocercospora fuligena TaxID=685502 RepID=A0A8H6RKH0_9PEZI|nr:Molybdenum cofactor sulfurase [Pseudocercospora fuligena]